jgi:hypothetical protein
MKKIKAIHVEKETKTIKHPVTGKVLYNESIEFQDKVKVRFLIGAFAGVVQELPELKAQRMVKAKKAEYVDKDKITPQHEIDRISSGLTPKKNETGKDDKKIKGAQV